MRYRILTVLIVTLAACELYTESGSQRVGIPPINDAEPGCGSGSDHLEDGGFGSGGSGGPYDGGWGSGGSGSGGGSDVPSDGGIGSGCGSAPSPDGGC